MTVQVLYCSCGGTLDKKIDVEELENFIEQNEAVSKIITVQAACTPAFQDELKEALSGEDKKIIALACTRSVCQNPIASAMEEIGLNKDELEIVNIREQVAYVHDDTKKATQKTKMMIDSSVEKVLSKQPLEKITYQRNQEALVVGGGIAGLTAASELADQGFNVHVVERKPTIGGAMPLISKTFPEEDCKMCLRGPQMIALMNKPGITYHVTSEVTAVDKTEKGFNVTIEKHPISLDVNPKKEKGQPIEAILSNGDWVLNYQSTDVSNLYESKCGSCASVFPAGLYDFDEASGPHQLEVGTVILATGFQDYDVSGIEKYGFGLENIITQYQLARLLDPLGPTAGKVVKPSNMKQPENLVMIQCVGSRDPDYNSYCSKYCCMAAIKHATMIKLKNPEVEITILYKDIRASGYGFESLYNEAKELGIDFVHGEVDSVTEEGEKLEVNYTDGLGSPKKLTTDMIALATSMVPAEGSDKLAELFNVEVTEYGFMKEVDEKVSNITTRVPGVFVAGACTSPKNIADSIAQAGAAAFMGGSYIKTHLEKNVNHPEVNEDVCGKCGICRSVCPYEAITIPEDGYPEFNKELCQSCGLCVSSCPTHALETPNYGFNLIDAQVDAILNNKNDEPLIIAFACDDCGYNLLDTVGFLGEQYTSAFIPIYVNCMSNLSLRNVLNAVKKGADGVMLIGCVKDRCHFLKGTKRSKGQMEIIKEFYQVTGLPQPIKILESSGTMVSQFLGALSELESEVREVGQ